MHDSRAVNREGQSRLSSLPRLLRGLSELLGCVLLTSLLGHERLSVMVLS